MISLFTDQLVVLAAMGEWDLTAKIGPYLDRHLVFPLLEFLSHKVSVMLSDCLSHNNPLSGLL